MFRCQDVSAKLSEAMDRKLPFHHRLFIRMHLMMCKYCAQFRRQLLMLRQLSRLVEPVGEAADAAVELPLDTRDRIKALLRGSH
ncbi:MAG: zf-HC2 domain-containing protein [Desulfobacterales bacterium]|nr:MAG: zf-HC2 domain-containing protein [Desulfobacterales bacterium]